MNQKNNQQNSDWREEFDKKFDDYDRWGNTKEIKDFISSTIQSEVDKAVKEREEEIRLLKAIITGYETKQKVENAGNVTIV